MKIYQDAVSKDPNVAIRMLETETKIQKWLASNNQSKATDPYITIPVVVHVLWNDPIENISDAQIQSQIDILNEDFRKLNADTLDDLHTFYDFTADAGIEFCLASYDPDGNPTNGITRTFTDSISFIGVGNEKYSASGGIDNWDPESYLNIWVCNLDASGGTLGYATFPSDLAANPDDDGVVIRYQSFGSSGTAEAPNDLGRTATHEVGHWLNLRHIWGDDICGDDLVDDTEPSENNNFQCPTFPHNANSSCGTGQDGEMYMNFMDYVDDDCMNMFTWGQSDRMEAAINTERMALFNSTGCDLSNGLSESLFGNSFNIFPNPSNGTISINLKNNKNEKVSLSLYNITGSLIKEITNINSFPYDVSLNGIADGMYCVIISNGEKSTLKKILLSK